MALDAASTQRFAEYAADRICQARAGPHGTSSAPALTKGECTRWRRSRAESMADDREPSETRARSGGESTGLLVAVGRRSVQGLRHPHHHGLRWMQVGPCETSKGVRALIDDKRRLNVRQL